MMLRCFQVLIFATAGFAQSGSPATSAQPPAGVDSALRARVKTFYDLLVGRQYRRAEEMVARDSRDIYYERDKPRYLSFDLTSIEYSDNFTQARVVLSINSPPVNPMIPTQSNMPVTSVWKLEDGAWYWSIPRVSVTALLSGGAGAAIPTPSGKPDTAPNPGTIVPAGPGAGIAGMPSMASLPAAANLPAGMGTPDAMAMTANGVMNRPKISLDSEDVVLQGSASVVIHITNTSQTPMTLFILGQIPKIDTSFDHAGIGPGEKCALTVKAQNGAKSGMLLIGVNETKEMLTLPVTVK